MVGRSVPLTLPTMVRTVLCPRLSIGLDRPADTEREGFGWRVIKEPSLWERR